MRRATVRQLTTDGDTAVLQLVKGSRWALLKNPVNLLVLNRERRVDSPPDVGQSNVAGG